MKKYYEEQIDNRKNTKKMWIILKELTQGKKSYHGKIDFQGDIKCENSEIANAFNKYFIESVNEK